MTTTTYVCPGVELSEHDQQQAGPDGIRRIQDRHCQSVWYAWGWIDGQPKPSLTLDDGMRFGQEQARACADYVLGRVGSLTSILAAWEQYRRQA